jgi:tetratricopeptide (TPR) repeat protein
MSESSARQISNQRLDSWKEIAAFFARDERTVRRWEKERGLPAHRLPGGVRGGVFAYTDELREWLKGRASELDVELETSPAVAENETGNDGGNREIESASLSEPLPIRPGLAPIIDLAPAQRRASSSQKASLARIVAWVAPLAVVLGLIVVLSFSRREPRFKNALAVPHPPRSEAQELYLKGEYHWSKRTPEDLNKAVDYFTQSIVKDPSYAQAYVGLADCYNLLREFSVMPPDEAFPQALAAAQKAVELDNASPGAHTSLAFSTFYWNWDPVTAEREYKRALELDPNFVQAHHWYATFLFTSGRYPEALDQIEQARKLDPSSTTIQADKGWILYNAGRTNEAFVLLKQLESTDPTIATTHGYLASIYFFRKDYANFFAESKQSAELRHDQSALAVAIAAEKGFAAGGLDGMRKTMLPMQQDMLNHDSGSAYEIAANCALLGQKEEALSYLQIAYEKHEIGLLYMNHDPAFDSLRDELRYKEITERVGQKLSSPRS